MKISIQVSVEHGVLFLYDPYEGYEIPSDTGAGEFTYTDSCICFWVPSYIDGNARVTVSDLPFSKERGPDFARTIKSSGKSIGLADPIGNYYCLLRLTDNFASINIWNYERRNRKLSWVQIKNVDIF